MQVTPLQSRGPLRVLDYQCDAAPGSASFPEQHRSHSLSFVQRGSFGYHTRGQSFELVPGAVLVGFPTHEFVCTHEHRAGGDRCLSFQFSAECVASLGGDSSVWQSRALPPLAELMVLGQLASAIASGHSALALDELGYWFAARWIRLCSSRRIEASSLTARDRKRAVDAAAWISECAHTEIDLESVARMAQMSAFHFLRMFSKTLGVSPHQYLIRSRLRNAARLLSESELSVTEVALEVGFGDLSNFVRTFQRAAGVPPGAFRRLARGDRKILQAKLGFAE